MISVVVPVHNGLEFTRGCLRSLLLVRRAGPFEIIVIDNGSTDGSAAWLAMQERKHPCLRWLRLRRNHGFAAGCNHGLRTARGEFLMILNNDTIVPPDLLEKLSAAWQTHEKAGLVAPVSNFVNGLQLVPLASGEGPEDLAKIVTRLERDARGMVGESTCLSGLCLFAHRDFYETVGPFEESYGIGNFEDDDLCLRARLAGYRLLIARDAFVYHFGHKTFDALAIDYETQLRKQERLHQRKWSGNPLYRAEQLLGKADWNGLIVLLSRTPADAPGRTWLIRCQARAEEASGAYADAVRTWEEFLPAHPLFAEGSYHHAFCLLEAGCDREGRLAFARAIGDCFLDHVGSASALTRFARYCWDRGLRAEAEDHLGTAFEICPEFLPALSVKSTWLLEQQRFHEAEALLLPFQDREDAGVLTNLGIALFRQGKIEPAIHAFWEGSEIAGPQSPAARNLARVLKA